MSCVVPVSKVARDVFSANALASNPQPVEVVGLSGACPTRWHAQGNYSDNIYSQLRGDTSGTKNEDSAQGFVRSTTKYWVRYHFLYRILNSGMHHYVQRPCIWSAA